MKIKGIVIVGVLVVLFVTCIVLLNRCGDDDEIEHSTTNNTDTTQIISNPILSEEERIDSLLRVDVEHDTTTMYELPKILIDIPQEIHYRFAYSVSYNPKTKIANWVAWSLSSNHTNGPFSRSKLNPPFYNDLDIRDNPQNYSEWKNEFPYEKGHMCPSADNKWDEAAMRQTFFYSNICPQHGDLNDGDWLRLEDTCRRIANDLGKIYIVAGPIFDSDNFKTLPEGDIAIPDKYFKVILCLNPKPMAVGFIFPNDDSKHRLFELATTVDKVEQITGIDFFYLIDDEIENSIESEFNLKDWKIATK